MDKCIRCETEPAIVSTQVSKKWMDLCDDCFGNTKTTTAAKPTKAEVKGSAKGAEEKTMKSKKAKKTTPKTDLLREMREAKANGTTVSDVRESKSLMAKEDEMSASEKKKKASKTTTAKKVPAKKSSKETPTVKAEPLKESDGFKFGGRVEYLPGILRTELAYKVAPWAKALNWCRKQDKLVGVMAFDSAKERDTFKEHVSKQR